TAIKKYETVGLQRVSDGWEKISGVFTAEEGASLSRVYFGGINKADLDGRIDNVTIIDLTKVYGEGEEPSKSEMDRHVYHNLSAGNGLVIKMPQTSIPFKFENLHVTKEYGKGEEQSKYEMDRHVYHNLSAGNGLVIKMPQTSIPFNFENLHVLFEKDSESVGYPASLTKILTAMVFLDNISDLDRKLTIRQSDIKGGSGTKFKAGDIILLRDALNMMLVESSNSIASAFSRLAGEQLILRDRKNC